MHAMKPILYTKKQKDFRFETNNLVDKVGRRECFFIDLMYNTRQGIK